MYLKATLTGLVTAAAACVLWVAVEMARLVAAIQFTGSGGLGAVSVDASLPVLIVAPAAFAIGFVWQLRRQRRHLRYVK